MTKQVKDFMLDQATGEVNVEYDDDSTSSYNLADVVSVTNSAQGIVKVKAGDVRVPFQGVAVVPVRRLLWGSYGDSYANITLVSGTDTHDIRQIAAGNINSFHDRMMAHLVSKTCGAIRPVFAGGIGGQTTAQMVAREAAAYGVNRRALQDAAAVGVEVLTASAGVNDCRTLSASSDAATIASTVSTAVGNIRWLIRKASSLGIYWTHQSTMGVTDSTAGDNAVRAAAMTAVDAGVKQFLDANPALGVFVDCAPLVSDPSRTWLAGMSEDGVHPTWNGADAAYEPVADAILTYSGSPVLLNSLPATSPNLLDNADLSASTSGLATRFAVAAQAGTATFTQQISELEGVLWQEFIATPTALDGNGNCIIIVTVAVPIFGATPYIPVAVNDNISAEAEVIIDDGTGGAPNIYSHGFRARKFGGTATIYSDFPGYVSPSSGAKTRYAKPFRRRLVSIPFKTDEASATLTNFTVNVFAVTSQIGLPIRIRIGKVRVIKGVSLT